jgi:hypothetical protein
VTALPGTYGDPVFLRRLKDKVADCMGAAGLGPFAELLWTAVMDTLPDHALGLESSLLSAIWTEARAQA